MTTRIVAVIPAHLASVRFPRKILYPFHGLAMIEHVRRRALLSELVEEVYVATCDDEIADLVSGFDGKVIPTASTHINGTSRVAEAVAGIDCTHVLLLQGDEPLLLPRHVDRVAEVIVNDPEGDVWNATGPIENADELDRHSFVKCSVSTSGRILYCFRRSPSYSDLPLQQTFTRKILGLIAYRKRVLLDVASLPPCPIEEAELIEQLRVIANGFTLQSVPVSPSLPSVNEPHEADVVLDYVRGDSEQRALLERTMA